MQSVGSSPAYLVQICELSVPQELVTSGTDYERRLLLAQGMTENEYGQLTGADTLLD